jgi:hypothetical protein
MGWQVPSLWQASPVSQLVAVQGASQTWPGWPEQEQSGGGISLQTSPPEQGIPVPHSSGAIRQTPQPGGSFGLWQKPSQQSLFERHARLTTHICEVFG